MLPLVSIIMPGFNCSKTVARAFLSVVNQTHKNWELLFVDDASTDNTIEIVQSILDYRIKVFRSDVNSGSAVAPRNRAIDLAKGKYIAFLDSDDSWEPNKLELQLNAMIQNRCHAACSAYRRVKNDKVISVVKPPFIISYNKLLNSNHIANLTGIYNCEVLGKFYQKDIGHEDYLMWLDILGKTDCVCVKDVLASYSISDSSLSSNKYEAIKWHFNILSKELKLPFYKLYFSFFCYVCNAIFKRL
ncbi:glycosyltransferase family 2 protein [Shewanella polaris]|uniref:Glycosyltransferase family 2 protein n=1 Tax=Shewanella polaris TaxID=2588449 RepID=A0A4Y5YCJ0_9GAMM|nr:glycosyltransferase family 2 protein [Shewanella polaris]QDE30510.1 glycosyltransferase family 2 protein [Shewanella polaris]